MGSVESVQRSHRFGHGHSVWGERQLFGQCQYGPLVEALREFLLNWLFFLSVCVSLSSFVCLFVIVKEKDLLNKWHSCVTIHLLIRSIQ